MNRVVWNVRSFEQGHEGFFRPSRWPVREVLLGKTNVLVSRKYARRRNTSRARAAQGRLYLSKISKCLSELGSARMSRFVSEHMKSMSGRGTPLTISNFRGEKEERTKWQAIG